MTNIKLYPAGTKDFSSGGRALTQIIADSDSIKRVRNGEDNGQLQVAATDPLFGEITEGMIVQLPPDAGHSDDLYYIQSTEASTADGTMTINLQHITALANNYHMITKSTVDGNTPQSILRSLDAKLDRRSPFVYDSNITTPLTGTGVIYRNLNPNELILGESNSLQKMTGGQVIRDHYNLRLDNITTHRQIHMRRGKNIAGVQVTRSLEGLVTQVVPYYTPKSDDNNKNPEPVYGDPVKSPLAGNYPEIYSINVDYSSRADNMADVMDLARKYWAENPDSDKPAYDLQISPVEYGSQRLEQATIQDDAIVYYDKDFGIATTLPVYETDYSPVLGINTLVKAGTQATNLWHSLESRIKAVDDKTDVIDDKIDNETDDRKEADDAVKTDAAKTAGELALTAANGRNKNYYTDTQPTSAQEGDLWFPGAMGKGPAKMYRYTNGKWVEFDTEAIDKELRAKVDASNAAMDAAIAAAGFDSATSLFKQVSADQKQLVSVVGNLNGLQSTVEDIPGQIKSQITQLSGAFDVKITGVQTAANAAKDAAAGAQTTANNAQAGVNDINNNLTARISASVRNGLANVTLQAGQGYVYLSGTGTYSEVAISGSVVHITGDTWIDNASIQSGAIANLDAGKIVTGTLNGIDISAARTITLQPGYDYNPFDDGSVNPYGAQVGTVISGKWGISTGGGLEVNQETHLHKWLKVDGSINAPSISADNGVLYIGGGSFKVFNGYKGYALYWLGGGK
ncbi:hypothetical protein, partial [Schleiferilactobacillus shenzhenensis]